MTCESGEEREWRESESGRGEREGRECESVCVLEWGGEREGRECESE